MIWPRLRGIVRAFLRCSSGLPLFGGGRLAATRFAAETRLDNLLTVHTWATESSAMLQLLLVLLGRMRRGAPPPPWPGLPLSGPPGGSRSVPHPPPPPRTTAASAPN